uniref:Uncharacterized protein n=1 Tax=viral metagenome TaxID=1070528 RepID=A0A6M3KCJ2_9ZZZZ
MANLAGIGAAGFLGGAEERAKEERGKRFQRERDALQMYTQLMQAGWKPVDEKRGVPEGEAIQLTPIGAWLRPPKFGKEEAGQLELEKARLAKQVQESQLKEQLSREEQVRLGAIISSAKNENDLAVAQMYVKRLEQEYGLREQAARADEVRTRQTYALKEKFATEEHARAMTLADIRLEAEEYGLMAAKLKARGGGVEPKEWQAMLQYKIPRSIVEITQPDKDGKPGRVPTEAEWTGLKGLASTVEKNIFEITLINPIPLWPDKEFKLYFIMDNTYGPPTKADVIRALMTDYKLTEEQAMKTYEKASAGIR